jgi:hypothetical protein
MIYAFIVEPLTGAGAAGGGKNFPMGRAWGKNGSAISSMIINRFLAFRVLSFVCPEGWIFRISGHKSAMLTTDVVDESVDGYGRQRHGIDGSKSAHFRGDLVNRLFVFDPDDGQEIVWT